MVDRRDPLRPAAPFRSLSLYGQAFVEAMADKLIEVAEKNRPELAAQFPDRTPAQKRQDAIELVEEGLIKFTWDPAEEVFGFTIYDGSKYVPL